MEIQMSELNGTKQQVLLQQEYVGLLGGDILVALMLCQIIYWYGPGKNGKPRLRVRRGNKFWIAKSWRMWQQEIGLSRSQIRRCLDILKGLGLIEVEVHRFNGIKMGHVRLPWVPSGATLKANPTVIELQKIMSTPIGDGSPIGSESHTIDLPAADDSTPTPIPLAADSQSITETTTEITTEIKQKAASLPDSLSKKIAEEKTVEDEIEKEKKKEKKITDEIKQGKSTDLGTTSERAAMLGHYWKSRLDELEPDKYHTPPTKQERGMLTNFVKCLEQSGLVDKAESVLNIALTDWWRFGSRARSEKEGWGKPPDKPQIGFFVSHHGTAVNILIEKLSQATKEAANKAEIVKSQAEKEIIKMAEKPKQPLATHKQRPTQVHFTYEQASILYNLDEYGKLLVFLQLIRKQYGEDCIIAGVASEELLAGEPPQNHLGNVGPNIVLCDISMDEIDKAIENQCE
jgi:hypothetical protein